MPHLTLAIEYKSLRTAVAIAVTSGNSAQQILAMFHPDAVTAHPSAYLKFVDAWHADAALADRLTILQWLMRHASLFTADPDYHRTAARLLSRTAEEITLVLIEHSERAWQLADHPEGISAATALDIRRCGETLKSIHWPRT